MIVWRLNTHNFCLDAIEAVKVTEKSVLYYQFPRQTKPTISRRVNDWERWFDHKEEALKWALNRRTVILQNAEKTVLECREAIEKINHLLSVINARQKNLHDSPT